MTEDRLESPGARSTASFPVPTRKPLSEAPESGPERFSTARPCPDPGHADALEALKRACAGLGVENKDLLCVAEEGCSGAFPGGLLSYGLLVPPGRSLPAAVGSKLVNPDLTVVAVAGASETAGPGAGALAHAAALNADVTFLVLDDGSAPASRPVELAVAAGATFAAQASGGDMAAAAAVLTRALQHRGFSLVRFLCGPEGVPPGVLHEAGDALSFEELDPVISRRGAVVRESLGLSPKEIAELEASLS